VSKTQAGLRKILSQKIFVEQGEPVDDSETEADPPRQTVPPSRKDSFKEEKIDSPPAPPPGLKRSLT